MEPTEPTTPPQKSTHKNPLTKNTTPRTPAQNARVKARTPPPVINYTADPDGVTRVYAPTPKPRKPIPLTSELLDREERAVASLLTRFRNLVTLASSPVSEEATKEVAAAQALQMEVETNAMVRGVEDLLQLSRELKELWLFGTLRAVGAGVDETKMDEDSVKVGEMLEEMLAERAEASASTATPDDKANEKGKGKESAA